MSDLKGIQSCIKSCNNSFQNFCADMKKEDVETSSCIDFESWDQKMSEIVQQVPLLLSLSQRFMTQSSKETLYLAALHAAEYAADGSECYEILAKTVAEYIESTLNHKAPTNAWLAIALDHQLRPVDESANDNEEATVVDLAKYKQEHKKKK